MKVMYCDYCKEEIPMTAISYNIALKENISGALFNGYYDLCEQCFNNFKAILESDRHTYEREF